MVTSAQQHGMTAIEWADKNAEEFRKAFAFMNASNDDFIRTTQDRHKTRVIEYVTENSRSGAISTSATYSGWYDASQEEYLTETVAKESPKGPYTSPVTGQPLVKRTEKNYFFKLSRYLRRSWRSAHRRAPRVHPARGAAERGAGPLPAGSARRARSRAR